MYADGRTLDWPKISPPPPPPPPLAATLLGAASPGLSLRVLCGLNGGTCSGGGRGRGQGCGERPLQYLPRLFAMNKCRVMRIETSCDPYSNQYRQ